MKSLITICLVCVVLFISGCNEQTKKSEGNKNLLAGTTKIIGNFFACDDENFTARPRVNYGGGSNPLLYGSDALGRDKRWTDGVYFGVTFPLN